MSAVYLATDRLTVSQVALKRVLTRPDYLLFAFKRGNKDLDLALAQEFKTLASLFHPTIVSVLDYGFDTQSQPYFTMEYFPDLLSFTKAAQGKSLAEWADLLVQVPQLLTYLHRRNLLSSRISWRA